MPHVSAHLAEPARIYELNHLIDRHTPVGDPLEPLVDHPAQSVGLTAVNLPGETCVYIRPATVPGLSASAIGHASLCMPLRISSSGSRDQRAWLTRGSMSYQKTDTFRAVVPDFSFALTTYYRVRWGG
jgi:hypothetical protein